MLLASIATDAWTHIALVGFFTILSLYCDLPCWLNWLTGFSNLDQTEPYRIIQNCQYDLPTHFTYPPTYPPDLTTSTHLCLPKLSIHTYNLPESTDNLPESIPSTYPPDLPTWHTRLTHPPDIYVGYMKYQFCNLSMFLNCPVCAVRDLKCDVVLDMATLTGAQVAKCHTINISNSIINREYRMAAIMPVHYLTLRAGRQLWLVLKWNLSHILIPSPPDVQDVF